MVSSASVCSSVAVVPLVGAWIEIYDCHIPINVEEVAPLVGAWIEMRMVQV